MEIIAQYEIKDRNRVWNVIIPTDHYWQSHPAERESLDVDGYSVPAIVTYKDAPYLALLVGRCDLNMATRLDQTTHPLPGGELKVWKVLKQAWFFNNYSKLSEVPNDLKLPSPTAPRASKHSQLLAMDFNSAAWVSYCCLVSTPGTGRTASTIVVEPNYRAVLLHLLYRLS